MDLRIKRTGYHADGILGQLLGPDGAILFYTLEHSYLEDDHYAPKLAGGRYLCVLGAHRLHGMTEDFQAYEVMGVPEFQGEPVSGILFHWGNYNRDSEGCILLGMSEAEIGGVDMVTSSRNAWAKFMSMQTGCESFILTVG